MRLTAWSAGIAAIIWSWSAAFAAGGNGELWEITTKMEMEGMAMPGGTNRVCVPKGSRDDALVPQDAESGCRMVERKHTGNTMRFRMACPGKDAMTASGEITYGADACSGRIQMTDTSDGETTHMTQTFSGRKLGACDVVPPRDNTRELVAADCRKSIEKLDHAWFTAEGSPCLPMKGEFCAHVGRIVGEMGRPEGYVAVVDKHRQWRDTLAACGHDGEPVTRGVCGRAVDARQWDFVGQYCDVEMQTLGPKYCAGRRYTALKAAGHVGLCRNYVDKNLGSDGSAAAVRPSPEESAARTAREALGAPVDAVEGGVRTLRGLIGF